MTKPQYEHGEIKLSHMGIFIRCCLLSSMWLSTGFMIRYTFISIKMCDYAASNAVAVITFLTTLIMSLLLYCPKALLPYQMILYELVIICTLSNCLMGYFGPGECIPILPDNLRFAHFLSSFSFGMSLILMMVAPKSKIGILTYKDSDNNDDDDVDVVDDADDVKTIGDFDNNSIDHVDAINR